MDKVWKIYKHTNKKNKKVYIGLTCRPNVNIRWRNGKGYGLSRGRTKFARAIKKYGWDNFDHEIIETGIMSLKQAEERERYWIKYYDSYHNGYNMNEGGSGHSDVLNRPVLQLDTQTLEVIKEYPTTTAAGEAFGELNGSNITACCRHKQNTAHGFYWCYKEERGSWSPNIPKSRKHPVYQIDVNDLHICAAWPGVRDAAKALNISEKHIASCCTGNRSKAGGYYWCYIKNFNSWRPLINLNNKRKIMVECVETGHRYLSYSEAARAHHLNRTNMRKAARSGKRYGNLHWREIHNETK